jgi:hypothetical protein
LKFAAGLFSVVLANSNIFTPAIGFSPDDSTGAKVAVMVAELMVAFCAPGRQISLQLAGYSRSATSSVAGKAVEKCYDRLGHGTGTTPCFQTGLK